MALHGQLVFVVFEEASNLDLGAQNLSGCCFQKDLNGGVGFDHEVYKQIRRNMGFEGELQCSQVVFLQSDSQPLCHKA